MTDRQTAIINYLRRRAERNQPPPTIREIGEACGISSTSVVNYNLDVLQGKGLITRDRNISRSVMLCAGVEIEVKEAAIKAAEPVEIESDQAQTIKRLQLSLRLARIEVQRLKREVEGLRRRAGVAA